MMPFGVAGFVLVTEIEYSPPLETLNGWMNVPPGLSVPLKLSVTFFEGSVTPPHATADAATSTAANSFSFIARNRAYHGRREPDGRLETGGPAPELAPIFRWHTRCDSVTR